MTQGNDHLVGCVHVKDVATYKGKLYLCLKCVRMYCEECALQHVQHPLIPQIGENKC